MDLKIETPDQQTLVKEATNSLAVANAYKITDATVYQLAAGDLQQIKARITALDEHRKSITKPLDDVKSKIMDLFRGPIDMLKQAESAIKTAMTQFDDEQERLRLAEQERLRKLQELEQMYADAYAENARIDIERAEQAAAAAATPEAAQQAQTALEQAAEKLEHAQAERIAAVTAPTAIVATAVPKVAGISRKTTWRGEVTDKMALIKAVAEGSAPITLLDVNETALNQMARALKGAMNYPGVKAVEEKSIASSRR